MTLDLKRYPILVVDDEQDNLDAFRFNFRKTFDIVTASGGAEALQILQDKEVAVVVTDQRMPRMTGVELLREVRLRRAHQSLLESDPSVTSVASIAYQWGFTNFGRFAAAHKAMFGQTPLHVLHSAH